MRRAILVALLVSSGVVLAGGVYLFASEHALAWLVAQTASRVDGTLTVDAVRGRLIGPWRLHGIDYTDAGGRYRLQSLQCDWRLRALWRASLEVTYCRGEDLRVATTASEDPPAAFNLPEFALPIRIRIQTLEIAPITVTVADRAPVAIDRMALSVDAAGSRVTLKHFRIAALDYSAAARGALELRTPHAVELEADWSYSVGLDADLHGTTTVSGDLSRLTVENHITGAADLTQRIDAENLFNHLTWNTVVEIQRLDTHALRVVWPTVSLSGRLQATGNRERGRLSGSLSGRYANYPRLDVDLAASLNGGTVTLEHMRFHAPDSEARLRGSGTVQLTASRVADLALTGDWEGLRWPLQGAPQWLSTQGRFSVRGSLDALMLEISDAQLYGPESRVTGRELKVQLALSDVANQPRIRGEVLVPHTEIGKVTGSGVAAELDIDTSGRHPSRAVLKARSLSAGERSLTDVTVLLSGRIGAHHAKAEAGIEDRLRASVSVQGGYADGTWTGNLVDTVIDGLPGARWRLRQPAEIQASSRRASVAPVCIEDRSRRVCLRGSWEPEVWRVTAEADRLPLDDIARQVQPGLNVSGSVSGSAQIGSGANTPLETHGMLTLTSGAIGYPPLTGAESFAHSGGELTFNLDPARGEAAFEIGLPSAARLDGAVSIRDPLNADLSAQAVQGSLTARLPDVSAYHRWWPAVRELRGALDAELSLGGSRAQPEFVAAVSLTDAALGSEGVGWAGDASAEAWLRRSADDEWSGSIQLSAPRGHITYPKTDDAGDLEYRDLVASAELASQTLDAEIRGGFRDGGVFNGRLAVSSVGAAAERSALDGQLSMHLPNLRLFQSLLPEYGPDPGTLDVNLDIGGNRAQPEITATAALTDAGLGTQVVGWAGDISASGSMHRSPGGQWSGSIQLSAPRGRITSPKTDNVDDLEYRDLLVNAELANQDLDVQLRGEFAADGAVAGRLAVSAVGATAHRSALDGELSIHFPNLRLLQSLLPEYGPDQGTLDVDLIIGGSRAQPAVTGSAMVADAQFTLPKLGITLADVNASLQGAGGDRLTLDGIARSGAGKVSARGDLSLRDGSAWRADVIVQGENVTVMDQPEAHVLASPDLRLVLRPTSIKVDGTVLIPEAEVRPAAQQAVGVVVSRDVVLVETDTDRPQTAPMTVHANIDVRLGDRVSFDGFGISGKLTGALSVNDQPGKATTATGELQIGDGQYVVYGQSIPIQTGRLVFAGGVIDNPGLDARAERKVRNVTAGARVRGTAAAPELVLYSEPDLPDADKLSYLILGRSTSEASGAEGAILFSAATSLLPQGGGQIRETLRNTFGLDELSVQGADENGEGSSLVLGKYLAPRLYVSYAAGLAEAINVFRIRYELSKRWTVQTESSQRESGGDLLYTIER